MMGYYASYRNLTFLVSESQEDDGLWWLHASVSRSDGSLPTWADLETLRELTIGPSRTALQMFVPAAEHCNATPRTGKEVLHLWAPEDGVLPMFPHEFYPLSPDVSLDGPTHLIQSKANLLLNDGRLWDGGLVAKVKDSDPYPEYRDLKQMKEVLWGDARAVQPFGPRPLAFEDLLKRRPRILWLWRPHESFLPDFRGAEGVI